MRPEEGDEDFNPNDIKPCLNNGFLGYECLREGCPYLCHTSHEHALCYVNEKAEAEKIVTLGDEMMLSDLDNTDTKAGYEAEVWKEICGRKINEAYEEYMRKVRPGLDYNNDDAVYRDIMQKMNDQ